MCEPNLLDLAEAGYQAYGDEADWMNHAGNPMPSWGELPEPQRGAWVAATRAIHRGAVSETRPGHGGPRSAYEASHPMISGRSGTTAAACRDGVPGACPQHVEIGDRRTSEPGGRA